jgi:myo-inositol-1(or 4)-monophosphatase
METPDPFLSVAVAAAKVGGQITSRYFSDLSTANIVNKLNGEVSQGLVTKADVESEQAIVDVIRDSFPDHHFLAEEEHADSVDAKHLWIIDPLDGTNNFAHGIPQFAVSVAYYRDGRPHCGAILKPATGDLYTAVAGGGAFANGKPVRVNDHSQLDQTMIGVGFYYDRGEMMNATLESIGELFSQNVHGIRRMGAAALDLVGVGMGQFGGFFEYTLSPWDFAAAALFITEAGGTITDAKGQPLQLKQTSVLASNSRLHVPLQNIVGSRASSF